MLPGNAVVGLNDRRGFHITSGGAISGTLNGSITAGQSMVDISGLVEQEIQNQNVADRLMGLIVRTQDVGAISLDGGNSLTLTHTEDINFRRPDITVTDDQAVEISPGRFAGIRAETDQGDVTIDNQGDITLRSGDYDGSVTNTNEQDVIANFLVSDIDSRVLNNLPQNSSMELNAVQALGSDNFSLIQRGDIVVEIGSTSVSAETSNSVAASSVGGILAGGIVLDAVNERVRVVGEQVRPNFTGDISLDMVGNLSLIYGDIRAESRVTSTAANAVQGSAFAVADSFANFHSNPNPFFHRSGNLIHFSTPGLIDINLVGELSFEAGLSEAIAHVSLGGNDERAGLARAMAEGRGVSGIELDGSGVQLRLDGGMTLRAGNARTEITAAGNADQIFGSGLPAELYFKEFRFLITK